MNKMMELNAQLFKFIKLTEPITSTSESNTSQYNLYLIGLAHFARCVPANDPNDSPADTLIHEFRHKC